MGINNGLFFRLAETIWDDGERDKLSGSSGNDWFILSGKDRATDLQSGRGDDEDIVTNRGA